MADPATTTLRFATPTDAPAMLAIYSPFVTDTPTTFETVVPSVDDFARRIQTTLPTHPWLVATTGSGGAVDAYAYAAPHRGRAAYQWCCEVSVYVAAPAQRRGIGHHLYEWLFALLRAQGFVNAYAGITLPNTASVRFHEGLGFVAAALFPCSGFKLGEWHDVGWWSLRLQEPATPQPPRPPAALPAGLIAPRCTP